MDIDEKLDAFINQEDTSIDATSNLNSMQQQNINSNTISSKLDAFIAMEEKEEPLLKQLLLQKMLMRLFKHKSS
jgi:hypothetical protein